MEQVPKLKADRLAIPFEPISEDDAIALIPLLLGEVARLQVEIRLHKYVCAVSDRLGVTYKDWKSLPTTALESLLSKLKEEHGNALDDYGAMKSVPRI